MNNQHAWNYIGQSGKVAIVALQHDRKSGDLVVFYGKELLWAERGVRTAQTISFFVDDELCKIHLSYTPDGRINYEFEIDRKADTPLNRIRKTEERNGFLQGVGLLLGILGVLGVVIGGGFLYNKYTDTKNLRENGRETTARLELYPTSEGKNCTYTFMFNGVACTYPGLLQKIGDSLVLPCGLPAHTGDEVMLRFDPSKVMNHTVDWAMPSPDCAMSLVRRLRDRLLATQPKWCFAQSIMQPPLRFTQAECLAIMAHRLGGFSGMADMYYGEEPMFNNLYHNELTFGFQRKRPDFKDDIGECF